MTDDYAKNLLLRRALYQQQRRAEQERRRREEGARSPIQPLYYIARSAGSGEVVLSDRQGNETRREIITNSQQLPGQKMLAFGNIASQMPAPYPLEVEQSRRPQSFEFGNATYLIEAIYDVENEAASSCETEPKLTAIFTRRKKSRGQVAILYAVIELRQGQHPESLCPCDQKWAPTTNGCVPVCTRDGEFTSQQACENWRANPGTGAVTYQHLATRLSFSTETYTAGSPYGSFYYGGYYNLFIVRPKDGGSELTNYDEFEAKWFRDTQSGREYLEWWQIELILVGGHDRYVVPNNILAFTASYNIIWNYPLLYSYPWQRAGAGSTPPPAGKLFQATFHWSIPRAPFGLRSKIPRYTQGQPDARAETDIMLPAFEPHGRVASWQTLSSPGSPPYIPPTPRTASPTQQGKHYIAKIYFKVDEEPILLGEYLLPNSFNYSSLTRPSDNFIYAYLNPEDVDAYLVCTEKDTWEVIIKTGLFSERRSVSSGDTWNYPRCVIDKFIIKKGSATKTRYKFPQGVIVGENNWAAPILQNWYWERTEGFSQAAGSDRYQAILGRWSGFTTDTGFVINPGFTSRIYAEYLSRLMELRQVRRFTMWENQGGATQLFKIQGAELGSDLVDPRGIPNIGCSFFKSADDKIYAIDTGLNQFIPAKNDILIEAIKFAGKSEEISVILKGGEVEVLQTTDQPGRTTGFNKFRGNLRLKNPRGIEAKVLGLNEPKALILEAQPNWIDFDSVINSSRSIYYNIYQSSFTQTIGEGDTVFRGVFTWAEKFPVNWSSSETYIPTYDNWYSYPPSGGIRLPDCNGNLTNPQGRIGTTGSPGGSLSAQDWYQFNRRPRIVGLCQ